MVEYAVALFQEASDTTWEIARGAHGAVLQEMESGRISWDCLSDVQKVRATCSQRVLVSNQSDVSTNVSTQAKATTSSAKSDGSRKLICKLFNAGTCSQTSDHNTKGCFYTHQCTWCYGKTGSFISHSVLKCTLKNKA